MKLVGEKYLLDTLRQVINQVVNDGLDCEVRMSQLVVNIVIVSINIIKVEIYES